VNFTFDTIAPVPGLVIVVPDLYLPRELRGARADPATVADLPGIGRLARFGTRTQLAAGWREWLLRSVGRADLAGVAPACIAATALEAPSTAATAQPGPARAGARWIAMAVHLRAGLTRVHLDHRGLLRLSVEEQAELAGAFADTFGPSNPALRPLPAGEFLLDTPDIIPVAAHEPARCVGAELDELMPAGVTAAALRRLLAEIEMWLHAQPLNERRSRRGAASVTGLWPWGAIGRIVRPERKVPSAVPLAFGEDAWLEGLCRLTGSVCRPPPEHLEEVLGASAGDTVLLSGVGGQLRRDEDTVAEALLRLDQHFILPALQALRHGTLESLSVIINDTRVQLRRGSLHRFWRRARRGLEEFA
jgi:hypothetical protein